ncbi:MAG: hypothetical protein ABSC42_02695, partial [Tepidisphaeraceae bacterium]
GQLPVHCDMCPRVGGICQMGVLLGCDLSRRIVDGRSMPRDGHPADFGNVYEVEPWLPAS